VAYGSDQGENQATRAQTEAEYVAVAAYTPIEQGTEVHEQARNVNIFHLTFPSVSVHFSWFSS